MNTMNEEAQYDVIWSDQSLSSKDSMPFGGHNIGCNVWVEKNEIYLYFCQSGSFDENGTLLKGGRIKISFEDSKLMEYGFQQRLHLKDGYIGISFGQNRNIIRINFWCSISTGKINIQMQSNYSKNFTISYQTWRYRDRVIQPVGEIHQCRDFQGGYSKPDNPKDVITYKDKVEITENSIYFYHKNNNEKLVTDILLKQQELEEYKEYVPDILKNRISGGMLIAQSRMEYLGEKNGEYLGTDYKEYVFAINDVKEELIEISVLTEQYDDIVEWKKAVNMQLQEKETFNDVKNWWNQFFDKSYIVIDPKQREKDLFEIGHNYQLFRYMLGCNYYGKYPTKFNGGLFTYDVEGYTPDFRKWGGIVHTAQNQRLLYWPMLKTGDTRAMKSQFDYYNRINQFAEIKTKYYWNHKGSYFNEQGSIIGLCGGHEYGWNRSDKDVEKGLEDSPFVKTYYTSGLEFAQMILEYARYTDCDISEYFTFILDVVLFYIEHYKKNCDGKLDIFPSTALETYKGEDPYSHIPEKYGVRNPMDVVAALKSVVKSIEYYTKEDEIIELCNEWKKIIPDYPVKEIQDKKIYLPALDYKTIFNCDIPQLYIVFPYSPFGLSEDEKETAINTYFQDYTKEQLAGIGWEQNGIFAARLNLKDEAYKYLRIKFNHGPVRFPAFWGPGFDWIPDHNQGGSGMIGLQEMLMQCDEQTINLFPAWDKSIDVSFKLYAPHQTVVECDLRAGKIERLIVLPETRKKDIILC